MLKAKFLLAPALLLLVLTCATARAQEQTPTPETSNDVTTGTISGLVVNERGEPMPGTSVFLRSMATRTGRSTSADAEGRFRAVGLEPGLYTVTGYSPAYVLQAPEFETAVTYYRVGDSVRVEMIKGGVITGTIINAMGEPVIGVRVRAIRIRDPKGQPVRAVEATPAGAMEFVFAKDDPKRPEGWRLVQIVHLRLENISPVISVGLVLWTLIANVASDGTARPLPALPLLNPLDIGIGIALAAVWVWTRSEAPAPHLAERHRFVNAALAVAGFVWLNAILVRAFHHHVGVPYRFDAWTASLAVQTGITLLWTATALVLMWFSAHRAARVVWMVGAALLAAVVLKLLLVDLSGSGTVARIISFIGVGALMLVIGYVAPLPAKGESHAPV